MHRGPVGSPPPNSFQVAHDTVGPASDFFALPSTPAASVSVTTSSSGSAVRPVIPANPVRSSDRSGLKGLIVVIVVGGWWV